MTEVIDVDRPQLAKDPCAIAEALAPVLAERAEAHDAEDRFVAENYAALRASGLVEAGVPRALGGGGAEVAELAEALRALARACGSTALAFAMHTHQVAIPAWRWAKRDVKVVEPLLRRVASERIVLLSAGGSDWIPGSGRAERVEGGYRITARKPFTSGAPAGDVLMTGAVLEEDGVRSVLHFGVSMKAPEVRIEETWRALGMRGTGSQDVVIDGLFVPEAGVALKRPSGEWHPIFEITATLAFPLIYAVYLGVAESARDIALGVARRKPATPHLLSLAGRMETALRGAQIAHGAMLAEAARDAPSAGSVDEVMKGKALVTKGVLKVGELALELAGGAGFYRATGLERRFRDLQGARLHPLQAGPQAEYAGAMALGLPVARIY